MQRLVDYALQFAGTRYIWGGDNPNIGLDCSGFVQLVLKSAGEDPPGDQTAQALFDHFMDGTHGKINTWGAGSLAFYGKGYKGVSHVALCIDAYRIIHAAGGSSECKTPADADRLGAFIRCDLIKYRNDLVAVVRPLYNRIGYY